MYSLLIVDDEDFIRNAMVTTVDWQAVGFAEVMEAEDGEEAIEIMREHPIDVLLTDISMPFMDGLELCRITAQEFPDTYRVILSGYDDFQYAQKAIRYGVKDYLLKPLGAETLQKEMDVIFGKFKHDASQRNYIREMKIQWQRSIPQLREQALYSIVCNGEAGTREIERMRSLDICLEYQCYGVAIIEPNWDTIDEKDVELFTFAVKNIVNESVAKAHYVFSTYANHIVVLFCFECGAKEISDLMNQELLRVSEVITSTIDIEVVCAVGSRVECVEDLKVSYEDALNALDCKYSLGKKNIYNISDLTYIEDSFYYPRQEMKDMIYGVKFEDEIEIGKKFYEIKRTCYLDKTISKENLKMIGIEIITSMLKELSNVKNVSTEMWAKGFEMYRKLETIDEFDKVIDVLCVYACEISRELKTVKNTSTEKIIEGIRNYVNDNYMNEETSQITTAEYLHISSGYLSAVYKKETGENFIKYLTDVRLQRAMELLQTTDKRSYEVAEETGFNNAHYFSTVFKKNIGCTPSEYRERKGES